ncbi:alpha/beta fold hydrolase [Celeribacter litoreus]|uniref:alpha/beta fold hydrolase n=1 Tax=Celeribacter litoreus TaxID=2876714 RepID=UPI001CCC19CB|nr:alpha/beta hydrolase [Celeribacter litoreus]MCA0045090.1 alpha/beta hydrolase [Celeribacter litoreus]
MPRITVNDVSLNVTLLPQSGRGENGVPMIFVHGLAASQAFWYMAGAPLLARLGPATLYDLRGHGKSAMPEHGFGVTSMTRDLLGLMDQLEIPQANIVAHSYGGMIALLAALRHPERVKSLLLADVRVRPLQQTLEFPARNVPPKLAKRLAEIGINLQAIERQDDGIDYLKTVANIQLHAGEEADELLRELYSHPQLFRTRRNAEKWIALTERASFIDDMRHGTSFKAEDLTALKQPILAITGANSTTGPSAQALKRYCPQAIVKELPGVGHFFPMSHPKLFLRPAARFLRAVNSGRLSAEQLAE